MEQNPVLFLDLFIRSLAVGELILLVVLLIRRPFNAQRLGILAVLFSVGGFLLLTAPISNQEYGNWRNFLLLLTDTLGYSIWFAAMVYFRDGFSPKRWPLPIWLGLLGYGIWYLYFFGVRAGRGSFHDFNHAIAVALLVHVIYVALQGWSDDLVDRRRRSRIVIAVLICVYGIAIAAAELSDLPMRDNWIFSVINAAFICIAIALLARNFFSNEHHSETVASHAMEQQEASDGLKNVQLAKQGPSLPASSPPNAQTLQPTLSEFEDLARRLNEHMINGGYREQSLTVKALAQRVGCQEHRLRQLINQSLGYRNFTQYINAWRLRDARAQLEDPAKNDQPILTLALDLGYGSVGPFNRAFKAQTGRTPSEYRKLMQSHY